MKDSDFINLAATFVICDNGFQVNEIGDLDNLEVMFWHRVETWPMEEIKEFVELLEFQFKNVFQIGMVMSASFWYDLLTDKQKTELKRDYSLAIHAGEKEFTSLGQMWDTGYVTYLREYLRNRDEKSIR